MVIGFRSRLTLNAYQRRRTHHVHSPSSHYAWVTRSIVGLSSAILIISCADNKVSQCNLLITTINQAESDLQNITQSSTPDIDALEQIATTTEQAVTNLNGVELANADLKGFQSRFQQFYGDISKNTQAIVTAHGEQNMEAAEAAYQSLEKTFTQQESLVDGVNQYCSTGVPE